MLNFLSKPTVIYTMILIFILVTDWNNLKVHDYVFITIMSIVFIVVFSAQLYIRFSKKYNEE